MRFEISDPIPLSRDETFLLLRDDMPSLVPFLDDADDIRVIERREDGDDVHLVNLWQGSTDRVPGPVRKFIRPDLLSWKDHATWHAGTTDCSWRLEPRVVKGLFECHGTTSITDAGADAAQLTILIHLEIHPEVVPGVPRFVAKRIRGQLESFIGNQLTANMRNLAGSIRAYAHSRT